MFKVLVNRARIDFSITNGKTTREPLLQSGASSSNNTDGLHQEDRVSYTPPVAPLHPYEIETVLEDQTAASAHPLTVSISPLTFSNQVRATSTERTPFASKLRQLVSNFRKSPYLQKLDTTKTVVPLSESVVTDATKDVENMQYLDGSYTGQVGSTNMTLPHGKGTMRFATGDVYDGEWINGKMHGTGTMRFANGGVYEGEFRYGEINGKGTMRFATGEVYDGEWVDGEKHGQGTYTYADGEVYDGDWVDGEKHGQGTYAYADGSVYEGEWNKDGRKHGKGKCTYADGSVYEGEWVDGKMHGTGTMRFANGNVYSGEWVNGKMHGQGTCKYANGNVYDGKWVDGKKHGQGTYTFQSGSVLSGIFKDGIFIEKKIQDLWTRKGFL